MVGRVCGLDPGAESIATMAVAGQAAELSSILLDRTIAVPAGGAKPVPNA
jgi:hypothetical protein